jgi:hypothetical protein
MMTGFLIFIVVVLALYFLLKLGERGLKAEAEFIERFKAEHQFNPSKIYKLLLALDAEKKLLAFLNNGSGDKVVIVPLSEIAVIEKYHQWEPGFSSCKDFLRVRTKDLKEMMVEFGGNDGYQISDWIESVRILSGVVSFGGAYVKSETGN